MGGLRLSEREGAYTVAPSIQGKQQQTTDDPEFALNDPKGTADDAPQETNMKQQICLPKVNGAVILVNGLPNPIEIPASEGRFLSMRRVMKLMHSELMKDIEKTGGCSSKKKGEGKLGRRGRIVIDYLLENIVFDGFTFVMRDASGRTWLKMHTKAEQHT
ncbi:hypothetical protein EDD18DRAFT_1109698 [Armillaria luteobubalina]|uniref:Uncharacterized protein n=1 Tax=Armillaria luteobubalina TaxID=153913 RepID=A0AA39PTA1_9AGAR|nr:hypothetical protein EDD18DRAFT_1109698 [Armillaria luteobubalina]